MKQMMKTMMSFVEYKIWNVIHNFELRKKDPPFIFSMAGTVCYYICKAFWTKDTCFYCALGPENYVAGSADYN